MGCVCVMGLIFLQFCTINNCITEMIVSFLVVYFNFVKQINYDSL